MASSLYSLTGVVGPAHNDANWDLAKIADVSNDDVVDMQDLVSIYSHFMG